jgi:hypothetical protein
LDSMPAAPAELAARLAELIARQQEQLMQIHMADALAANLMTVQALQVWTTAAVNNPGSVFAMAQQNTQVLLQRGETVGSSNSSSSSSRGVVPDACFVDWASIGTDKFVQGCCTNSRNSSSSSSSSSSSAFTPGPAASMVGNTSAEFLFNSSRSSGNSSTGSDRVCLAGGPSQYAQTALNVRLNSTTQESNAAYCSLSSTIQPTALLGLSPYQMFPTTGDYDTAARQLQQQQQRQQQTSDRQAQQQQQDGSSNATSAGDFPGVQAEGSMGSATAANNSSGISANDNSSILVLRGLKQQQAANSTATGDDSAATPAQAGGGSPGATLQSAVQFPGSTAAAAAAAAASNAVSNAPNSNASNSGAAAFWSAPAPAAAASQGQSDSTTTGDAQVIGNSTNATAGAVPNDVWVRVTADQLAYFSLLQLAELLADGRLTPQQLAAVYLSRLRR